MVLAACLGTLYSGAQLDSGLKTRGCGYSSRPEHPCCSLAVGNLCVLTGSSCSCCAVLDGGDWGGTGREVVGECPAARFVVGCALSVPWCSSLPRLMHQFTEPSPWPGEDWHSLGLKAAVG